MEKLCFLAILGVVILGTEAAGTLRTAIAFLKNDKGLTGNVTFEQHDSGPVTVHVVIDGVPEGKHGFHIHEKGDISNCLNAGGHYNPHLKSHGGRNASERHVGDLGNVETNGSGQVNVSFQDNLSLTGEYSIIGRSVVIHEKEDDLGTVNTTESKTTGSAGNRLACGVIGIKDPVNFNQGASSTTTVSAFSVGVLSVVAAILSTI